MAGTFSPNHVKTFDKHLANMRASLNHRLEVARAAHNNQLVSALEQEKQQIEPDRSLNNITPVADRLKHLWQQLVDAIVHANDLQVWTTTDGGNALWWHAYNPRSGKSVVTDSESEMRLWIEANYWED